MPVYDVERYLPECLDSILSQPFDDLEVVVVDDGSPDGSAGIVESYAAHDPRVRLHRQQNAGLGAARNNAVPLCRGELLTFVDSDDVLPPDAYTPLVESLDRTGSDLVVGKLKRLRGGQQTASARMRRNHAEDRLGVTAEEMPTILADVWAMNKVYRRSFWDSAGLRFPEGVRYEDQPTLTEAFLRARSFDVLRHTSYLWRVREEQTSITQRRHEVSDLRDRLLTKRMSTRTVRELASPSLQRVWFDYVLPVDMVAYFRQVPGCSDEYWSMLRDAMAEFWGSGDPSFEETHVPVQQRLLGWLVSQGRRSDVETVVDFLDEHEGRLPLRVVDDHVECLLPGHEDDRLPRELFVVPPHEHRWEARVTRADLTEGRLVLEGFAFVRNVPTGLDSPLTVTFRSSDGLRRTAEVTPRLDERARRFGGRQDDLYDGSGFTASVPVIDLAPGDPGATVVWDIDLRRRVGEVEGSGTVTGWPPRIVAPGWRADQGVAIRLVARHGRLLVEVRRDRPI